MTIDCAQHVLDMVHIPSRFSLLLVLALQCVGLHAELVFRNLEQAGDQPRWSAVKKYSNPLDVADARASPQEVRVFVTGDITREDKASAAVMADLIQSGRQRLSANTVWFGSNGGDIDAAMDVGRLLRRMGVSAVVDKSDQCMSACVFAFMGGERRSVDGRLGIHRPFLPYTQDFPDRQAQFRHMQRVLKDYVEELDFPSSLYEAVMLVPPESIKILSPAELKRFYLAGISPSSEDRLDAAAARSLNLSMADYLRYKATATATGSYAADDRGIDVAPVGRTASRGKSGG